MDNIIVYDMIDINSYIETLKPETFNGIVGVDINRFNIEFIKLLAGIYKLADANVNKLSDKLKKIKTIHTYIPEEEDEEQIDIENIILEVKNTLAILLLLYNDLYEVFVKFYNAVMTILTNINNQEYKLKICTREYKILQIDNMTGKIN